jgi:hypothetical protein
MRRRKNAQELSAMDTEVTKLRPRLERHARDGIPNLHTSTATLQRRSQTLVLLITNAETQMVKIPFGATPLIQRRDGNSVNHWKELNSIRTSDSETTSHSISDPKCQCKESLKHWAVTKSL